MEDTDANSSAPEEQPPAAEVAPVPVPEAPAPDTPPAEPSTPVVAGASNDESQAVESADLPADAGPIEVASEDPLGPLIAKSATQRLSAPEEEQAIGILRGRLIGKKDEFIAAVSALPKVGWAVASKSVGAAWPEMKATARNALIKILSADETEASRRIRLSIGRSLFKVPDLPASLKLITGAAKELRDKETGAVAPKDAQIFSNVMIGKGKPWIAQLSLAEAKPADVEALVNVTISAAFVLNQPPITQIGVLKWAAEAGRLDKLPESTLALVTKGVARMSGKWQGLLRKEVTELPEAISAVLKPEGPAPAPAKAPTAEAEPETESDGLPAELKAEEEAAEPSDQPETGERERAPRRERPVYVSKTIPPREQRSPERTPPAPPTSPSPQQQGGSQREGKGPSPRSAQFNALEVLRQVEAHIGFLKGELKTAENKLRTREDDSKRAKRRPDVPVIEGEPTLEELARLNIQLESRITELQSRIDDLTVDAEARATSAGAFADQPETDPDRQLRTLLSLKLQEAYADFLALEQEDRDVVVQQHFRTVLREVFDVLKTEGVPLTVPPESPT